MENQQQSGSYFVDLVMCIDATASMSPIINEVKANALSFYPRFVDAMEESGRNVSQLRIKVIAFRDYGCDSNPMEQSRFFTLPEENEEFKSFVESIEATGGGDIPENALEAIALALKSEFTTGGSKRRHVIQVFTDAPALKLGERAAECPNYPENMPADIAELSAWWEGEAQIDSTFQPKSGRLIAFAPDAEPWTDLQTWNRYWMACSRASTGLDDVDIETAIQLLVKSC